MKIIRKIQKYEGEEHLKATWATVLVMCFLVMLACGGIFLLDNSAVIEATGGTAVITLANPYKNYANNYKGNLHAHSNYGPTDGNAGNNDDGLDKRVDIGNWYKNNGYAFWALTGHYIPFGQHNSKDTLDPNVRRMTITPDPKIPGIVWMGDSMEDSLNVSGDSRISTTAGVGSYRTDAHMGMINIGGNSSFFVTKSISGADYKTGNPSTMVSKSVYAAATGGKKVTNDYGQSVIDAVNAAGGLTIFNHPYFDSIAAGGSSTICDANHVVKDLKNLTGVEIYNNGMNATNPSSITDNASYPCDTHYSGVGAWDKMLLSGQKLWGFANDDSHGNIIKNSKGGYNITRGTGFIIVNSQNAPSRSDILANIKAGNFYASTPTYTGTVNSSGGGYTQPSGDYDLKITSTGSSITVASSNGAKIRSVAGFNTGSTRECTYSSASITYNADGSEKYVRFEILNAANKEVAWSQPIFVSSSVAVTPITDCSKLSAGVSANSSNNSTPVTDDPNGANIPVTEDQSSTSGSSSFNSVYSSSNSPSTGDGEGAPVSGGSSSTNSSSTSNSSSTGSSGYSSPSGSTSSSTGNQSPTNGSGNSGASTNGSGSSSVSGGSTATSSGTISDSSAVNSFVQQAISSTTQDDSTDSIAGSTDITPEQEVMVTESQQSVGLGSNSYSEPAITKSLAAAADDHTVLGSFVNKLAASADIAELKNPVVTSKISYGSLARWFIFSLPFIIAGFIALMIGIINNMLCNRFFIFWGERLNEIDGIIRYLVTCLISFTLSMVAVYLLVGPDIYIAGAILAGISLITACIGYRSYNFLVACLVMSE